MARTGITLGGRSDLTPGQMVEMVRLAEEKGYESAWTGESWGREALTMLTMFACNTERIKLGTGIVNVFSRTPGTIAQGIATLDEVSGGRAILGLGTSGALVIEQWHGVKYERPLLRTREYIQVIRQALAGQRVDYDGEIVKVKRFRLGTTPVQKRIPIYIAALGPKNLGLTGELADGWLPIYVHVRELPGLVAQVEAGARSAGRSIRDVTVAPYIMANVGRDVEKARNLMRMHLAYYIGSMGTYYHELMKRYGFVKEADAVRAAWETDRKRSAQLVTDAMLDAVSIAGGREECRMRLEEYRSRGTDMPVLSFPHGSTLEMAMETIEALAPE
ncbi:MAG: LLM class flavin-dependent oxidoreductase [Chloroflexi bacterium]|nr:LLM class flavin-dependent oxidoreductase [Chloroflexota bacterium]